MDERRFLARQMAKSSSFFPPFIAATSHFGRNPLPDQVSPRLAGLRYFGLTFCPFNGFLLPLLLSANAWEISAGVSLYLIRTILSCLTPGLSAFLSISALACSSRICASIVFREIREACRSPFFLNICPNWKRDYVIVRANMAVPPGHVPNGKTTPIRSRRVAVARWLIEEQSHDALRPKETPRGRGA